MVYTLSKLEDNNDNFVHVEEPSRAKIKNLSNK